MILIGITGGIGSGKSVVAQLFALYGIPVYDSDSNAKRLMAQSPEIRESLTAIFGNGIYPGGTLDREALAKIIFADEEARQTVNAIVHPVVCKDFMLWADALSATHPMVAVESAILYECGLDEYARRHRCGTYTRADGGADRPEEDSRDVRLPHHERRAADAYPAGRTHNRENKTIWQTER